MATPGSVPDILAALRGGKYPYDFVQALTGTGTQRLARREVLDLVLRSDEGGEALANILIVGGRHLLNILVDSYTGSRDNPDTITALAKRIAGLKESDLDKYAAVPVNLGS